ncbi:MAG: DUF924 domain-containing protein [Atopostipes suicloacalis]|nr:DUF924 domain-containing protein [Atopostipes suicloacalis]
MTVVSAKEVYDFWFNEGNDDYWFERNEAFDQEIADRFYDTWDAGRQGLLFKWRDSFEGRLAEIIVLDQFSRNLNRGNSLSYAQDKMALVLSQHLINHPKFVSQSLEKKNFILLPWMHSESKAVQEVTEQLYLELDNDFHTEMMYEHKKLIDKFGRYPHRNEALKRKSTPEEIEFLKTNDLDFTK